MAASVLIWTLLCLLALHSVSLVTGFQCLGVPCAVGANSCNADFRCQCDAGLAGDGRSLCVANRCVCSSVADPHMTLYDAAANPAVTANLQCTYQMTSYADTANQCGVAIVHMSTETRGTGNAANFRVFASGLSATTFNSGTFATTTTTVNAQTAGTSTVNGFTTVNTPVCGLQIGYNATYGSVYISAPTGVSFSNVAGAICGNCNGLGEENPGTTPQAHLSYILKRLSPPANQQATPYKTQCDALRTAAASCNATTIVTAGQVCYPWISTGFGLCLLNNLNVPNYTSLMNSFLSCVQSVCASATATACTALVGADTSSANCALNPRPAACPLKDSYEQLIKKHTEELAEKDQKLEELAKEKDALQARVSDLQEQQQRMEAGFKDQFEERQAKYKETLGKLKERFEDKLREKDGELEARIQELMAQKDSGTEDLQRSLEQLRRTQLQEQQETHSRVLQETIADWQGRLRETVLQWENKLKECETQFTQQLAEKDSVLEERESLVIQRDTLLQEKDALLRTKDDVMLDRESLLTQKDSALQERESALQECRHQCTQLQIEHASMEEMLKALNETSSSKDEQIQSLTLQLSDASQMMKQIDDLQAALAEKERLIDSVQTELGSVKSKYDGEMSKLQEKHEQQLREAQSQSDSKLAEMESNDRELQLRLKELNEKLTATEVRLQDCISNYESQIEDYRKKVDQLEIGGQEQVSLLQQQLKDLQARSETSSSELHLVLQQKVEEGEMKLLQQLQDHQAALVSQTQAAQDKHKELKQKYVAKLREIQAEGEEELKKVREHLQHEKEEKEAVSSELTHANTRLLQMEETSGLSHETITDLECTVKQLKEEITRKNGDVDKLHKDLKELENDLSKLKEENMSSSQKLSAVESERESVLSEKDAVIESQQQALTQLESRIAQQQAESDQWQKKAMELEEQLLDLRRSLSQAQAAHQGELDELKQRLDSVEVEKKELSVTLHSVKDSHKDLEVRLQTVEDDRSSLKQTADSQANLQTHLAEILSERDLLKQEYESQIQKLQSEHTAQIGELTSKFESENTNKVSEYKKRAEAYIAQVKKQLTSEKDSAVGELQSTIKTLLEETTSLKSQLSDLTADNERAKTNFESRLLEQLSRHEHEQQKNQTVIDEQNKQISTLEIHISELKLQIETLTKEQSSLQEKHQELELSHQVSASESQKFLDEVRAQRDALQREFEGMKCDKDGELDSVEQQRDAALEKLRQEYEARLREQEEEHGGKIKQLAKDLNRQLMDKEREFEETLNEAIEKSQRGETDLLAEHQTEIKELRRELKEREDLMEELRREFQTKMEEQGQMLSENIARLQEELSSTKQRHQVELWEKEERLKASNQRALHTRTTAHKEEVTALMKEWNQERKSGVPVTESVAPFGAVTEEIVQQNQAALMAVQSGTASGELLRQQVISLTRQLEDVRERHQLEVAELQSQLELSRDTVLPLVSAPRLALRTFDPDDPNLVSELQNLELNNMDLQAQLRHVNAELAQSRLREKDSQQRLAVLEQRLRHRREDETPPLSPDGSLLSHEDSALLREPTEYEYLKNILYEYMMGKETQTLTKVIATVVRFSEEQTRNVVEKAASKSWLSP